MTRFWPDTEPLRVQVDGENRPQSFEWREQSHPVRAIANCWRVDEGWWYSRTWREYFKLVTHTGLLVILYRDLLTGEWYLHRLYD